MDEMKIKLQNGFMRNVISKFISKLIFDKIGIKTEIDIRNISVEKIEDEYKINLEIDANVKEKNLIKLNALMDI